MSLQDKASIVLPKGFAGKASVLECWNPNTDTLVGFDVVRATTATRVNESGLIESVSANVPRRDFLNGGCGELLIEPQRTNVEANSNTFIGTGASVTTGQQSPTVAGNEGVLLEGNGTSVQPRNARNITFLSSGEAVISIRAKAGTNDFICLGFQSFTSGSGTAFSYFDLANGTTPTSGARIESLGNGWYQCYSAPYTIDAGDLAGLCSVFITPSTSSLNFASTAAANGQNVLLYGFQAETGAYGTSYIPTSGTAETRNADVESKGLIASLLSDSSGGLYIRGRVFDASVSNIIEVSNSSDAANERVLIDINGTNITGKTTDGGVEQATLNAAGTTDNAEFAVCYNYALNSFSIQKGGATAATDSAGTTPSGLNQVRFTDGSTPFYGRISEIVIFNQRPTNTQGEAVTA